MKIHLISPPTTLKERYGDVISKVTGNVPPLGILYISAVLKQNGFEVSVIDGSKYDYKKMISKVKKESPDVVGISCLTFTWNKVKKLAEDIKSEVPSSFIVVGGPHPTVLKRKCLEESPFIDAAVVGEGEYTTLDLVNCLKFKKKLKNVKGLIFRNNGVIKENEQRSLIKNLDRLPFPDRKAVDILSYIPALEEYKELPMTHMISSRGCPFQCIYCSKINGNIIRFRSSQNIIKEIEELISDYKLKEIQFHDDTFTANRKRVIEFIKLLRKNEIDVSWSVNSRIDTVDRKLLLEMKNSGCWKMFFGVESMIQKNLNTIKKYIKLKQIFNVIKWCKEIGIESECSFMFGLPGESYKDAIRTINKIIELDPDYAIFFAITPFPETELFNNIKKYGKVISNNWDDYTTHKIVFTPYTMTKNEIQSLISLAYKKFYLRPKYLIKEIKKIKSLGVIKKYLRCCHRQYY
jgi:magnesium-protoporphyrin IX monomethyl ester (oxidative) cyclase